MGIDRLDMPQMSGVPLQGSLAETFPRNPYNPREVDGSSHFVLYLHQQFGIHSTF